MPESPILIVWVPFKYADLLAPSKRKFSTLGFRNWAAWALLSSVQSDSVVSMTRNLEFWAGLDPAAGLPCAVRISGSELSVPNFPNNPCQVCVLVRSITTNTSNSSHSSKLSTESSSFMIELEKETVGFPFIKSPDHTGLPTAVLAWCPFPLLSAHKPITSPLAGESPERFPDWTHAHYPTYRKHFHPMEAKQQDLL